MLLIQLLDMYGRAYRFMGLEESHLIHLPCLHCVEGSSFPGYASLDDMGNSKSVVGIKPGGSDVVIGYQVDEFTCTWSVECFFALSYIGPG